MKKSVKYILYFTMLAAASGDETKTRQRLSKRPTEYPRPPVLEQNSNEVYSKPFKKLILFEDFKDSRVLLRL